MQTIIGTSSVKDALQALMKTRSGRALSIREFSRFSGYASDRAIGMVLTGQRDLSPAMQERIAKVTKLSPKEAEYLRLLARRERDRKRGVETAEIDDRLKRFQLKGRARKVSAPQTEGLIAWYAFALIELLKSGPADLKSLLPQLRGQVPGKDVEATLKALVDLGFIGKNEDGTYRSLDEGEYLETPVDIPSATSRAIHRAQLQRAIEVLEEQSVLEREFLAKTYMISHKRLTEFKARAREVMDELAVEFVGENEADLVVVQTNLQLYQQSRPKK
jgi:uncharacterized protein (TIGR02147 family)